MSLNLQIQKGSNFPIRLQFRILKYSHCKFTVPFEAISDENEIHIDNQAGFIQFK